MTMDKQAQEARLLQQNSEIETRAYHSEVRSLDSDMKKIGGLAARFDSYTSMGWFLEIIKPGFFDGMDFTRAAAIKNHDPNMVLGRTSNNTLSLSVTKVGLEYEVTLPDTTTANDTYEEVKRGDIHQSSFQFTVKESVWRTIDRTELSGFVSDDILDKVSSNGMVEVRELIKGGVLYDVSPVTFPAYEDTTVAKRQRDSINKEETRAEKSPDYEYRIRAAVAAGNIF